MRKFELLGLICIFRFLESKNSPDSSLIIIWIMSSRLHFLSQTYLIFIHCCLYSVFIADHQAYAACFFPGYHSKLFNEKICSFEVKGLLQSLSPSIPSLFLPFTFCPHLLDCNITYIYYLI